MQAASMRPSLVANLSQGVHGRDSAHLFTSRPKVSGGTNVPMHTGIHKRARLCLLPSLDCELSDGLNRIKLNLYAFDVDLIRCCLLI